MMHTFGVFLVNLDYNLFGFFNGLAGNSQVWDSVFVALAEYVIYAMVAALALFVILKKKDHTRWIVAIQALFAAFIGRALIDSLIRAFYFRPRPFVAGIVHQLVAHNPLEAAFPSGHATVMFALAFSLFYADKRWAIVYLIIAAISSIARIVVGVHFPLDIFGGALVGLLSAVISKAIFDFWIKRRAALKLLRK